MKIYIEDLTFQAIIGILDFERERPQDVIINLTLEYNFENQEFINYALVVDFIKNDMQKEKYLLLEDVLASLPKKLYQKFSKINTLTLKITKPSILPDCRVSLEDTFKFES